MLLIACLDAGSIPASSTVKVTLVKCRNQLHGLYSVNGHFSDIKDIASSIVEEVANNSITWQKGLKGFDSKV